MSSRNRIIVVIHSGLIAPYSIVDNDVVGGFLEDMLMGMLGLMFVIVYM